MNDTQDAILFGVSILAAGLIYFTPTFVAAKRGHSNLTSIFLLNLLLGWAILGWIVALIWSVSSQARPMSAPHRQPEPALQTDDTKACPFCAETIKAKAVMCRFCGKELGQPHM